MLAIAVHKGNKNPELIQVPRPSIGSREILVRGLAVGVCGTDHHIIRSGNPNVPPGDDYLILGHEGTGHVEAVGDAVEGFQVGMLVVPCVRRRESERPFRSDFDAFHNVIECGINQAHGFAREYWVDQPEYLYVAPDELGVQAVLTETFTVSEKAVNESVLIQTTRLTEKGFYYRQPRVLVTGLGPIAFAAAFIAQSRGFDVTIAGRRTPSSPQAQLAKDVGLSYVDTSDTDFSSFATPALAFDIILEATGNEDVFLTALASLAERGILCAIGSERKPEPTSVHLSMLLRQLIGRNQVIFGVVNAAAPRDFERAFTDMLWIEESSPGALERLITHRSGPHEYLKAYGERAPETIKRIICWGHTKELAQERPEP